MSVAARVESTRIAALTALIRSTSAETRTLRAPFTDEPIAEIPSSSLDDVDAAFATAHAAQDLWGRPR